MEIQIDGKSYLLACGRAVLIFPNQIHSMKTPNKSHHLLCVFSPKLVASFSKETQGLIPESHLFDISAELCDRIGRLEGENKTSVIKGVLYTVCGEFDRSAVYKTGAVGRSNQLLYKIFEFIEKNYTRECSLKSLSHETCYDYSYLSKFFKRNVGMSFNDYVNNYRISQACYLLKNTDKNILEIAADCGYRSVRGFNRNFKEQLGMTPCKYRNSSDRHADNSVDIKNKQNNIAAHIS